MTVLTQETCQKTADSVRWDLSDLFTGLDDPRIKDILSSTDAKASAFQQQYKSMLETLSPDQLGTCISEKDALIEPLYMLSQYSHLMYSIQTQDDAIRVLVQKVDELCSIVANHLLFFELELGQMSEASFSVFFDASDEGGVLSQYRYKLQRIRQRATYKLSEKEEQMVNLKDLTGVDAIRKLYTELTASYRFSFDLDGKKLELNGSELRALRQHVDPDVRRRAMEMFFERYKDNEIVFSHLYNGVLKDCAIERKKRGYESSIQVMNISNDLSDDVIQILHDVTSESVSLVQRYYKLKASMLKLDRFTLSDIYAPIPEAARFYEWSDAKEIVLDSFHSFDSEFHAFAKQMFDEQRVDAPVTKSKRGGAYCSSSIPSLKPYVMLNYMGRPRDIATLSHEFGHAIHAMYSKDQPLMNYHSILPVCETASVFSEMVLMDYLKAKETDVAVKKSLLTGALEDIFATSHRQNMFSRFEMSVHQQVEEGFLSSKDLSTLYKSELHAMFGDSITYTDEFSWEWATIPHIFDVPFYVYAYNFGNLLVIALYQQYLDQGPSFIPTLKEVLRLGSSVSPTEITSKLGVDISDPNFWRKSLVYIEGLIDELEALV